jgi:SAM-dependent methyltransferase
MRVGLIPENPIEWILDRLGFIPRAMLDTFHGPMQARAVMIAVKLGVFESLADTSLTTEQIAAATNTHPPALEKMLNALVACRYLTVRHGQWKLRSHTRRWMLRSSRHCIADSILHRFVEWKAFEGLEQFIATGQPMEMHDHLPADDWPVYQRGMKSLAGLAVGEVVTRMKLPENPRRMLDIGGSHGVYSAGFCRRYPTLEAVVLDLPEAVEHAAPLLAEEKMGSRVIHQTGDAMTTPLGEREWDFIFVSQLLHHFTAEMNQALCTRIQRSLRPGGTFAIADLERSKNAAVGGQVGTIFDLYFAATSRSGTWSAEEMQRWQTKAGMKPDAPMRLWTVPGIVIVPAGVPASI